MRARSIAISPRSFSARSAAVACSASGRSRFRTSSSRSRARSTCDRDARELQLGAMAARLEAAEPGRLLDQRAPLLRLRREDRLDLALADDRVHALAEPEVGEQLDEVEPPHGGLVDEVLALAAAVEPPRDRELGVLDGGPVAVVVVEEQLDLAEVGRPAVRRAGEEHVVGLLGAQLVRAERAGRPADRVGDVRLAGAVRPDDHADARLEAHLDRIREGLEATQLDGAQMHRRRLSGGAERYRAARARRCTAGAVPLGRVSLRTLSSGSAMPSRGEPFQRPRGRPPARRPSSSCPRRRRAARRRRPPRR